MYLVSCVSPQLRPKIICSSHVNFVLIKHMGRFCARDTKRKIHQLDGPIFFTKPEALRDVSCGPTNGPTGYNGCFD